MQPPKLIIFDLDGTLVEFPHEFLLGESLRIIELLGHPQVPRLKLEAAFADFDFFRFVEHPEPETFIESFWAAFNWEAYPRSPAFIGAEELCAALRGVGSKLAAATARIGTPEQLLDSLSHTRFGSYFDCMIGRVDTDHHWMDKVPQIQNICAQLSIDPAEAMLIGDVPPDIESAKKAGVGCTVAVLSGGIKETILRAANPDLLLQNVADLHKILKITGQ